MCNLLILCSIGPNAIPFSNSLFVCTFRWWWYYVKNRTNSDPVNAIVFDLLNIVHGCCFQPNSVDNSVHNQLLLFNQNASWCVSVGTDEPPSTSIPLFHLHSVCPSFTFDPFWICVWVWVSVLRSVFYSAYMFTNSMTHTHTSIFYDFSAHMHWMNGSSRIQMHTQFTFTIRMH